MNAIEILKRHENIIKQKYSVKRIGVFGSFARGTMKEKSDVDVLVEFENPVDIFEFIDLKDFLEELLNRKVDLVSTKALKPFLRDRILNEAVYA